MVYITSKVFIIKAEEAAPWHHYYRPHIIRINKPTAIRIIPIWGIIVIKPFAATAALSMSTKSAKYCQVNIKVANYYYYSAKQDTYLELTFLDWFRVAGTLPYPRAHKGFVVPH